MSDGAYRFKVNLSWTPKGVSKTLKNSIEMSINGTLPTSIKIVQVPSKTIYKSGEKVDLSGIVVHLLDENGNLWKSKDYPYGIIPVEELTPDPSVVTFSDGDINHTYTGEQE